MMPLEVKNHIRLIYSANVQNLTSHNSVNATEELWAQLDLFASEKPDTVIFAQPEELGFNGIVKILLTGHARQIFDFREMPYFSFGNETRENFLKLLSDNRVAYFNKFHLKSKLGYSDNEEISLKTEIVKSFLKPLIENGPTVVFSDKSPNKDDFVVKFLKLLSEAKISYSTVLAES
jgi:hypothetical protein